MDITKALTTYLDTPISDTLPSPAELFFNRRINTRLSMNMTPVPLTDQVKSGLSDKRSAHLKSTKKAKVKYGPISLSGSQMTSLMNGDLATSNRETTHQIRTGLSMTRATGE